jgi:hypothetical protein
MCSEFKGQRDANSRGSKNFSKVSFLSKVEFSLLPWFGYGPIYSLQMELKGRVRTFLVYGRLRIMDLVM